MKSVREIKRLIPKKLNKELVEYAKKENPAKAHYNDLVTRIQQFTDLCRGEIDQVVDDIINQKRNGQK